MSNEPTYNIALTEAEIRELHRALTTSCVMHPEQITDGTDSALDKVKWSVDFLDSPETFWQELSTMRAS